MRTWVLILLVAFLPGIVAGGEKGCMTDPELMAEVAARYLVEQEYKAVACSYLYQDTIEPAPGMLLALARDVALKFQMQFSQYEKLRRARFQSLFGEKWDEAWRLDYRGKLLALNAKIPWLAPEICAEVKQTWEQMLFRDWTFVRGQLDVMIGNLRPTIRMCRVPNGQTPLVSTGETLIAPEPEQDPLKEGMGKPMDDGSAGATDGTGN